MQVDNIRVRNFKRIRDVTINLSDITYLVGGNNSGKSSVLQAVHMAVGCAQLSAEFGQQVIAESSLRYCPTGDFVRLGNSSPYENRGDGSRGSVEFVGSSDDDTKASYRVEIYKARNYHNIGVERIGSYNGFGQNIVDPARLFSVYVPGLAGIPHKEEQQSYAAVFRRAAGGDANLVFRNILRLIYVRGHIEELENLLFDIIGECKLKIVYDDNTDLNVEVFISFKSPFIESSYVPIDLSGTGALQICQILSYVILFKPKILLVDEPDSHLHPSRQSLLSTVFDKIVETYGCRVIVSTHSRHLISSAPDHAKIVWLKDGKVATDADNGLAAMLMDIGALDQLDATGADFLICTEDKSKSMLQRVVKAAKLEKDVKVISYNGVTNASAAEILHEAASLFGKKPRVIVHRDRDYLTNDEVATWAKPFSDKDIKVFCPKLQDIETYHLSAEHLAGVYGLQLNEVEPLLNEILEDVEEKTRAKFREKRREANKRFWQDGGSPKTEDLWPDDAGIPADQIFGKILLPAVNERFSRTYGGQTYPTSKSPGALETEVKQFLALE